MKVARGQGGSTTTKCETAGGEEGVSMANSLQMGGYSVAYFASVANPLRGTRGRSSSSSRISSSGRSKGGSPPPGRLLLGSRSGFFIT